MAEYVMEYDGWAEGIPVGEYLKVRDAMHARKREEVVRCGDCESATDHCEEMDIYWCEYLSRYVGPNTFCAWGVRRDDA